MFRGLREAECAVHEEQEPDEQPHAAPGEGVRRVLSDLLTEHGELLQRRADDAVRDVLVADEPQDRREDQQQREQREKPVVGEQRGELRASVVTEFLDDAEEEADDSVVLLRPVEPSDDPLDDVHARSVPRSGRDPSAG